MRDRREQVSLNRGLVGFLVLFALGFAPLGCSYDPDDRCDSDQELYGEAPRCVCTLPKVWSPSGCVECPAGEVPTEEGCVCAEGQARSANLVCTDVAMSAPSVTSSSAAPDAQVSCDAAVECADAGVSQ